MCADAELARRATGGDRTAVGELYRRYAADVAAVCAGRGPSHEVDDLVHDTFMALLACGDLDEPAKVRNWLVKTAWNIAVTAGKAHRNSRTGPLPRATDRVWASVATDDHSAGVIDRAALRQLLDQLDDRDAAMFVEHYHHGAPLTALADTFATTPGAIRTRMHRVRARLQASARRHGLTRLVPAPLLRLLNNAHPLQAISEPAVAALLPIIAALGLTAAVIQTPATDAETKSLQSIHEISGPVTSTRQPDSSRADAPATPPSSQRTAAAAAPHDTHADSPRTWSSTRPPLIDTTPIGTPAGDVTTDQPSPPNYEYGADPGITLRDTRVDVVISIHDEPALEPAAAATCPTFDATPATYCHQGEQ